MPPKRSRGKKAQSPIAGGSDRTPAAQPPPAKKLKYDQPTSAQPPPAAGRSDRTPVAQSPPPVESDHTPPAPVSNPGEVYLGLLQKFWHSTWGKEDAFKASRQGSDGNSFDYLDFGAHFEAVHRICPALPRDRKLCILQEYDEAFARFERETDEDYELGACIIGQPGIGKTCFIAYAVVQRLRKKLPVAVEESDKSLGQYWLFTAGGVSIYSNGAPLRQHPGVWAFSDSNARILFPTVAFTDTLGVRTFQVTSPQEVRYKEWTKQSTVDFYYMDLPSKKDIINVSLVGDRDTTRMRRLAKKWGPILRILHRIHDKPRIEKRYEDKVTNQLQSDAKDIVNVLSALNNSGGPNTTEGSSMVFFIRPCSREDGLDRLYFNVSVPTHWLQDKVIDALRRREEGQKLEMFNALLGILEGRGAAGGIFERIVHTYFVNHTELDVRWYTDGGLGPPERVSFGRLTALPAKQDLELAPLPCYWRPRESNFATIDCAILTDNFVYAIQATSAATHSFNISGLKKFSNSLKGRADLLKGFLVIGYTEQQTERVTKDLVRKIDAAGEDLLVGGVTFGCNIVDDLEGDRSGNTKTDELSELSELSSTE